MKVNIWISKEDVMDNKIRSYYYTKPKRSGTYVQVTISQEEFVQLEDSRQDTISSTGRSNENYKYKIK